LRVTIRLKVILLVAAVCVALGMVEVFLARSVLIPSFAELERADARTAMRRINYALEMTLDRLELSATDWGNWADTYRFVRDHNADYVSENVTDVALRELNVNAFAVVDGDGNIVEARELDLNDANRALHLELLRGKALPADFPWRANLRAGRAAQGLVQTNRGILMLAAAPVLDGQGRGPARGMVLMGRLLSHAEIMRLGARAQVALAMLAPAPAGPWEQLIETDLVTHVYRTFQDVYGHALMRLRVDVPREITARGRSAIGALSVNLLLAATFVLVLLLVALNRLVLNPLARVTRHAIAIGEDKDLTARLDFASQDEIGVLARELDRTIERLAQSRRQLVDQSFEAGFAELAKGVLHNLGNAMTPLGVRLAKLGERLRAAPSENAVEAVAELERPSADATRRADVEQFVRMACCELARIVATAREDLSVMSRQASVVQTALAEQMRTARNAHVIEPVRLTELVAQSLEIVPDECRQRLRIETDESVRQVGVVRVARTVLRLVLQNIVINAADAVRDAAKDRGVLRIAARIARSDDGEQLHVTCQDDGVGIPAEALDRVFEKNFSTKSKETNCGIGLHWCANAIVALGGRIWAASDGRGHGASIHVVVPLELRKTRPLAGAA
jgi:two-component system, NtrC family, sensor kinase